MRPDRESRWPLRAAGAAALLGLVAGAGCAGRSASWHVPEGQEARFRETRRVCRMLTDEEGGAFAADRFERCMQRRGWSRENLFQQLF